eukprot:Phypoly_transcript_01974.p1 GENE.Phypoly_transcript_01974~~Phypoly_transcript_01974.p1  ORF type:complete len:541 (+),score=86.69 Phypoly_transcript_01974:1392-3014(+)
MDVSKLAEDGIIVTGHIPKEYLEVVPSKAILFVAQLARRFEHTRRYLLQKREEKEGHIRKGNFPAFREDTRHIREKEWQVDPVPPILQDRKVDVVCLNAADVKTVWECMNSDAKGIQVDFDDGYSPTWINGLRAQDNLKKAAKNELLYNGKAPKNIALLLPRPRSLNLLEAHMTVDGSPVAGAFFDFGIFWFHNAKILHQSGRGPFFYLPKLESSEEAKMWDEIFEFSEKHMNIPVGTTKAIVLIENILASFEMDEILYALRRHSLGLNAGRWDYIFSFIKKFSHNVDFILHERAKLGLDQPFLANYYKLLVHTCHKRGAHATGGMAPQVPLDPADSNLMKKLYQQVKDGKSAEAKMGCDGALVAHPYMVPACKEVFDAALGTDTANGINKLEPVNVYAEDLLKISKPNGVEVSLKGVKAATRVVLLYICNWLKGTGAVVLDNIVEDIATCEISRSLLWQWIHYSIATDEGQAITPTLIENFIKEIITEEIKQKGELADGTQLRTSGLLALSVVSAPKFIDFLPTLLYPLIVTHNIHAKL